MLTFKLHINVEKKIKTIKQKIFIFIIKYYSASIDD